MKIALFADVHGNKAALDAVLDDIDRHHPDAIVCAGDAVNPFPGSEAVWRTLRARNIPTVRGNHEDYMLAYYQPDRNPDIRQLIQFMPIRFAARQLSTQTITEIDALPLTHTVPGPHGDDVLVCHASPLSADRSFSAGIDADMATALARIPTKTIAGGHVHMQWQMRWRDKFLVLTGSVGLPFGETTAAQYLMLTHRNGRWHARHRTVPYNLAETVHAITDSRFLVEGGPIAWLMLDELLTAELRMVPFLRKFCPTPRPETLSEWQNWVRRYLEAIGRWDALQPYIREAYLETRDALTASPAAEKLYSPRPTDCPR